jgi:hypothetical protein
MITGAGIIILVNNNILLVKNKFSGLYEFPGGTKETYHKNSKHVALCELTEETAGSFRLNNEFNDVKVTVNGKYDLFAVQLRGFNANDISNTYYHNLNILQKTGGIKKCYLETTAITFVSISDLVMSGALTEKGNLQTQDIYKNQITINGRDKAGFREIINIIHKAPIIDIKHGLCTRGPLAGINLNCYWS